MNQNKIPTRVPVGTIRIETLGKFIRIGKPVLVPIRTSRIGLMHLDLHAIGKPILIGVTLERICLVNEFLRIRQPIPVSISGRIRNQGVKAISPFPNVRQPILVRIPIRWVACLHLNHRNPSAAVLEANLMSDDSSHRLPSESKARKGSVDRVLPATGGTDHTSVFGEPTGVLIVSRETRWVARIIPTACLHAVIESVSIRIGKDRIGEGIIDLVGITQPISVTVRNRRIRPQGVLLKVGKAIPIGIEGRIVQGKIESMASLPSVGHAIRIHVEIARGKTGRKRKGKWSAQVDEMEVSVPHSVLRRTHAGKGVGPGSRMMNPTRIGSSNKTQVGFASPIPTRVSGRIGGIGAIGNLLLVGKPIAIRVRPGGIGSVKGLLVVIGQSVPISIRGKRVGPRLVFLRVAQPVSVRIRIRIGGQGIQSEERLPIIRKRITVRIRLRGIGLRRDCGLKETGSAEMIRASQNPSAHRAAA